MVVVALRMRSANTNRHVNVQLSMDWMRLNLLAAAGRWHRLGSWLRWYPYLVAF